MPFPTAPAAEGDIHPPGSTDPRYVAVGDPPKWVVAGRNPNRPVGGEESINL